MRALLAAFGETLREVLTTRALVSTTLVAVLFYAFYYPAPYRHQSVVDLPVVVVDQENTAVTRQVVQALDDTREVAVTLVTRDPLAAEREVRERRADGIVRLSDGLTRRLLTGSGGGGVSLILNGTYLLRAKAVGDALGAVLSGLIEQRLEPIARPLGKTLPVRIEVVPLFNSTTGYADYIFPAVSVVILQQTLLFGSAMLAGRRRARGAPVPGPSAYFGTLLAMTLLGVMGCCFYFGFVFWIEDMPRGGNLGGLFIATPIFSLAVAALGLLIGSFLDEGDRAMEVLVPTSVVLFFLTGVAWPTEMMPAWVRWLAMLSPATSGTPLFVRLNQMGASLPEVSAPLLQLALLALSYILASLVRLALRRDRGASSRP